MVALKGSDIVATPLEEVIGHTKNVDPNHNLVQVAKSIGIAFGD
jgi:6-phosphofructokinase 1